MASDCCSQQIDEKQENRYVVIIWGGTLSCCPT